MTFTRIFFSVLLFLIPFVVCKSQEFIEPIDIYFQCFYFEDSVPGTCNCEVSVSGGNNVYNFSGTLNIQNVSSSDTFNILMPEYEHFYLEIEDPTENCVDTLFVQEVSNCTFNPGTFVSEIAREAEKITCFLTQNHLMLNIDSPVNEDFEYVICDLKGMVLITDKLRITNKSSLVPIEISDFKNGIYVLNIVSKGSKTSYKFCKI